MMVFIGFLIPVFFMLASSYNCSYLEKLQPWTPGYPTVVFLGLTGGGKSSSINVLTAKPNMAAAFPDSVYSGTDQPHCFLSSFLGHEATPDALAQFIDTPGIHDLSGRDEKFQRHSVEMLQTVNSTVDVFIVVQRVGKAYTHDILG